MSAALLTLNRADDKSVRYVAQENITVLSDAPTQNLIDLAGRYFKRWDDEEKVFVSNIRDEYPHD
jgi:F-box protein 21